MAEYDRYETEANGTFMMGLLAGTVLGAGLGMLLAPKAGADLRGQIGEQARNIGNRASEGYRRATEAASGWAERGREMMHQAREAVAHGAEEAREAVSRGAEEARDYTRTPTGGTYSGGGTYTGGTQGSHGGTQGSHGGTDYGRS